MIIVIIIFIIVGCFVLYITKKDDSTIYGIMITGKSPCRILLAKESIKNFMEQDYANKRLIIINHGSAPISKKEYDFVDEYMVDKGKMTLGDLRNLALSKVPYGSYWTTWDDDDYRSTSYLSFLYKKLITTGADLLAYTDRYEYNYTTGYFWKTTLKSGFVTCLAKRKRGISYNRLDTMEDKNLLNDYRMMGYKVVVIGNNPNIYLRLVHGGNTSVYVVKNKHNVIKTAHGSIWKETVVSNDVKEKYANFLYKYYKKGLECMQNS